MGEDIEAKQVVPSNLSDSSNNVSQLIKRTIADFDEGQPVPKGFDSWHSFLMAKSDDGSYFTNDELSKYLIDEGIMVGQFDPRHLINSSSEDKEENLRKSIVNTTYLVNRLRAKLISIDDILLRERTIHTSNLNYKSFMNPTLSNYQNIISSALSFYNQGLTYSKIASELNGLYSNDEGSNSVTESSIKIWFDHNRAKYNLKPRYARNEKGIPNLFYEDNPERYKAFVLKTNELYLGVDENGKRRPMDVIIALLNSEFTDLELTRSSFLHWKFEHKELVPIDPSYRSAIHKQTGRAISPYNSDIWEIVDKNYGSGQMTFKDTWELVLEAYPNTQPRSESAIVAYKRLREKKSIKSPNRDKYEEQRLIRDTNVQNKIKELVTLQNGEIEWTKQNVELIITELHGSFSLTGDEIFTRLMRYHNSVYKTDKSKQANHKSFEDILGRHRTSFKRLVKSLEK